MLTLPPSFPGMIEGGGSPYPSSTNLTMPSPGPRQWPGSPSVPGPSPVSSTRHATAQSPGGHPALHSPHGKHATRHRLGSTVPGIGIRSKLQWWNFVCVERHLYSL